MRGNKYPSWVSGVAKHLPSRPHGTGGASPPGQTNVALCPCRPVCLIEIMEEGRLEIIDVSLRLYRYQSTRCSKQTHPVQPMQRISRTVTSNGVKSLVNPSLPGPTTKSR